MQELNWNNTKLLECITKVFKLFSYDAQTLLDCVLTDNTDDPQFSANMVYNRFAEIIIFERFFYGHEFNTVEEYLGTIGYDEKDLLLLDRKRIEEKERKAALSIGDE